MATTTKARKAQAPSKAQATEAAQTEAVTIEQLTNAYKVSATAFDAAKDQESAAVARRRDMAVYRARAAYRLGSHPALLEGARKDTKALGYNATKAAQLTGEKRPTLLPFLEAGAALAKAGLIDSDATPTEKEREIVERSTGKAAKRAKANRDKAKPAKAAKTESAERSTDDEATAPTFAEVIAKAESLLNMVETFAKAEDATPATSEELERFTGIMAQVMAHTAAE